MIQANYHCKSSCSVVNTFLNYYMKIQKNEILYYKMQTNGSDQLYSGSVNIEPLSMGALNSIYIGGFVLKR